MYKNFIILIVTIITLVISTLFLTDTITLNMAFFYLLAIHGVSIASIGMAFGVSDKDSSPLIPFLGLVIFAVLGFLCKTYLPSIHFSDLLKQ